MKSRSSFPELSRFSYFAIDTETTGLNKMRDKMFSFSISTPEGESYWDIRVQPEAVEWLNREIRDHHTVIMHNASFDWFMLTRAGAKIPLHTLDDTVIRECCINEHHMTYTLDYLGKVYFNETKDTEIYEELAKIFGGRATRNVQMRNIADAPAEIVGRYANQDARLTRMIWEAQNDEIERQDISGIVDWERSLMPMFINNEWLGVKVDVQAAERTIPRVTSIIDPLQRQLDGIAGFNVNVNSNAGRDSHIQKIFNPQYRNGFWFVGDIQVPTTPGGRASLGAGVLQELASAGDRRADLVVRIRRYIKVRDTFLAGHVIDHSVNGRVHPNINQSKGAAGGTATGRLSYSSPALQQIPSRDKELAALVRPLFLPEDGQLWIESDMASFEVRVFAHLVNNPDLIERFRVDPYTDVHQYVADLMGLPRNKPAEGGANAKQVNLSMIFNSGKGSIAEALQLPWRYDTFQAKDGEMITYKKAGAEAEALIAKYHRQFPGVKTLADRAKARALKRGYVFTSKGRRLRFPRGFKAYKASGLLIQATAADQNKVNWLKMTEVMSEFGGRLLLNTHDSYGLSVPEERAEEAVKAAKRRVEDSELRIPLILDVNRPGVNWWDSYSKGEWKL